MAIDKIKFYETSLLSNLSTFLSNIRQCNNGHHMVHGKNLVVSVFSFPPHVFFNSDGTQVTTHDKLFFFLLHVKGQSCFQMSGVAIDLVKIVASKLQFDLTLMPCTDWIFIDKLTFKLHGSVGEV